MKTIGITLIYPTDEDSKSYIKELTTKTYLKAIESIIMDPAVELTLKRRIMKYAIKNITDKIPVSEVVKENSKFTIE
jgi:hypothetical protein